MTGQELLGNKRIMEAVIGDAITTAIEEFECETGYRVSGVAVQMFQYVYPHGTEHLVDKVECQVQTPEKWPGEKKGK